VNLPSTFSYSFSGIFDRVAVQRPSQICRGMALESEFQFRLGGNVKSSWYRTRFVRPGRARRVCRGRRRSRVSSGLRADRGQYPVRDWPLYAALKSIIPLSGSYVGRCRIRERQPSFPSLNSAIKPSDRLLKTSAPGPPNGPQISQLRTSTPSSKPWN